MSEIHHLSDQQRERGGCEEQPQANVYGVLSLVESLNNPIPHIGLLGRGHFESDQELAAVLTAHLKRNDGSFGGAEGNRTLDLLNAIQALSQLSYGPTGGKNRSRVTHIACRR